MPAAFCDSHRLLQYLQEIVRAGEILHNGINDHQIKALIGCEFQFMCKALPQVNVPEVRVFFNHLQELIERSRREIQSGIALTMWRYLREQQTCAAANLQRTTWTQIHQARCGFIHPYLHLLGWNGSTGVTAVPAGK